MTHDDIEQLKFTKSEVSELIGLIHDAWGDGFDSEALTTAHEKLEKLISTLEGSPRQYGEE